MPVPMLFYLKEILKDRFGFDDLSEAIVSRVETDTQAVLYFFFRGGEKSPFLVVKSSTNEEHNDDLKHEFDNLSKIGRMLPDSMRDSIPKTEGSGEWRGLYYYAQRYIQGEMVCETIDDRPRNRGGRDQTHNIRMAYDWLLELQDVTSRESRNIREFDFQRLIEDYRRVHAPVAMEQERLEALAGLLEEAGSREIRLVACHGDYFPGNIIVMGGKVSIIDWRFLRVLYHPFFDLITLLVTFYTAKNGITDFNDIEGHFRELFFQKHWTNGFFTGIVEEFLQRNGIGSKLFLLFLELTLLEWSTREYSFLGESRERDGIWRRRLLFYWENGNQIIFRDME